MQKNHRREIYTNFAKIAKEEYHKSIARLFTAIGKVEIEYEEEYPALMQALIDEKKWVCEIYGHIHKGEKPPGEYPLCGVEKSI